MSLSTSTLEDAARAARASTRGELSLVVAPSSGSYRDVDHSVAGAVAISALVCSLYFHFHDRTLPEHAIPPVIAAVYVATLFITARLSWLTRAVTTRARRERQVREAARAAFVDSSGAPSPERARVLVYVSSLEGRVELVPDLGVEGKIEGARLSAIAREIDRETRERGLDAGAQLALTRAGEALARAFPRVEVAA